MSVPPSTRPQPEPVITIRQVSVPPPAPRSFYPSLSTLGIYDRSLRTLWPRSASFRDLTGRIHLQTKQRFTVLMGASMTTLRTVASWVTIFQQQVGRVGYLALSEVIAAIQAALASSERVPIDVAPRREEETNLGEYSSLDPEELAKIQKEIADIFDKTVKLPAIRSVQEPKMATKMLTKTPTSTEPSQLSVVAQKTAARPQSCPPPPSDKTAKKQSKEEGITTVSLFVTRPGKMKRPLHIRVSIAGA
jgi:hypothetical protein